LIVGPHDPSDRFSYWPARVARGGEILAPAPATQPVQIIDVRDLATFLVAGAEQQLTGVFNATGPDHVLTMGEVLDACVHAGRNDASLTWVPTAFLDENEVGMWMDMPLVVWGDGYEGFNAIDVSKAVAAGLRFRPISDTVGATLDWWQSESDRPLRAGVTSDKETEVLAAWHAAGRA
jgi:2'-hydroxyisoflavone reductase